MKFVLLLISILNLLGSSLNAQENKVLIIGIDGVRADALKIANTPNIDTIIANGTYSYDALNDDITISGPGWSAMLTGVWSNKHGVTDNSFTGQNYATYPHFFKRIKDHHPTLITASIVNWGPINDQIVGNHADYKLNVNSDADVASQAAMYLGNNNPDVLFLQFDECDGSGHSFGFSPTVVEYISAIETTDTHVGTVIAALQNRTNYANENWQIIMTTDHGGIGTSHGGSSLEEENVFFIVSGDSIPFQEIKKDSTLSPPPNDCLADSIHLEFDGVNDYVQSPSSTLYDFGASQDFTVECRILSNVAADVAILGNKDWSTGFLPGFVLSYKFPNGPEWKVNIGDGNNRVDINTGGNVADNEWHTLSVSFDRDGYMIMYEDGIAIDSAMIDNIGDINTNSRIWIGADINNAFNYNGKIAEVRIWNKVIPAGSIQNWHCSKLNSNHPEYAHLISYWRMVDGNQSSTVKENINNLDGQISGAIWSPPSQIVEYNYTLTPRLTDLAPTALSHLCIPIDTSWDFDGKPTFSTCPTFIDPCEEMHLDIKYLAQNIYHTVQTINSDAMVNMADIKYKAQQEVSLNVGFEVNENAVFNATIENCVNPR